MELVSGVETNGIEDSPINSPSRLSFANSQGFRLLCFLCHPLALEWGPFVPRLDPSAIVFEPVVPADLAMLCGLDGLKSSGFQHVMVTLLLASRVDNASQ